LTQHSRDWSGVWHRRSQGIAANVARQRDHGASQFQRDFLE
jgi:hypothetical protein